MRNRSLDDAMFAPILQHVFLQRFSSTSNILMALWFPPRQPSFPSQLQRSPALQSRSVGAGGEHWTGENVGRRWGRWEGEAAALRVASVTPPESSSPPALQLRFKICSKKKGEQRHMLQTGGNEESTVSPNGSETWERRGSELYY